jgi:hypothetical protein
MAPPVTVERSKLLGWGAVSSPESSLSHWDSEDFSDKALQQCVDERGTDALFRIPELTAPLF